LFTTCDRWRRRRPAPADAIDGRLGLVGEGRDDDREDQEQPEGDALDLDRHAGEPQRVLHDRDHEHGEHHPGDRASPAEDVDATQEHDGDHGQGHPLPGIGPGAREAGGQDHARERRDRAGQHEQGHPQTLDPHAGEAGRAGALADREDLPAGPRLVQDDAQDDGQGDEDHERPRDQRPRHVAEAQRGELRGEVAHALGPEDDQREATEQGERAQGDDERRQAAARHQQAVHQAAEGTDADDQQDGDPDRHAGRPQEAEHRTGETGHRLDGQVDLAGDDDQRHGDRHDRHLHEGGEQVREVARGQEYRRQAGADDDEGDQDDEQERLPTDDRTGDSPGPSRGAGGGRHRSRLTAVRRWMRRAMNASALTATRITTP
jgi:hypothetical protein